MVLFELLIFCHWYQCSSNWWFFLTVCNLVWTGIDIYTSARQILIDCAITSSLSFICSSQVANMVISMNGNFVFRLNSWCFIKLNQLEFFALQNLAFHTVVLEDLKANCQDIKKILSSCFFLKLRHWFCEGDFSVEFPSGLLVSENILVTTLLRDWNFFSCIY